MSAKTSFGPSFPNAAAPGVDYLDYYWLHSLDKRTYRLSEELHAFRFVQQRLAEGSVRHIGFFVPRHGRRAGGNFKSAPGDGICAAALNYLDWESSTVQARKCYELCEAYGRKVIVMEPLKGGALANPPQPARELLQSAGPQMGMPEWGLRFAASHKNVVMVLSGMSTMEQVEENIRTMQQFSPLRSASLPWRWRPGASSAAASLCPARRAAIATGAPKTLPFGILCPLQPAVAAGKTQRRRSPGLCPAGGQPRPGVGLHCCGRCEQHCPQHRHHQALRQVAQALETT
ncbi:MAG: aldo/keto reductase [Ruthenibacterium lactatiformans]